MRVEQTLVGLIVAAAVTAAGCHGRLAYNLPPAERLMHPGPGVGGPGPGVIPPVGGMAGTGIAFAGAEGGMIGGPGMMMDGAVCQAGYNCGAGCCSGGSGGDGYGLGGYGGFGAGGYGLGRPMTTSQIAFLGDEGIQISWDVGGYGTFDSVPLITPGRQDFYQGAIYRLKLTNIPGRPGVELYPTLEVAPVTPRTDAYLAHAPIPVQFTVEDFDQVTSGNFVTKVIYLPDPEFQELALAGVETLVSTRLDPGVDPIAEADRRGSILAIVRMGNKALELSGSGGFEPNQVIHAAYNDPHSNGGPQTDGEIVQAQYSEASYGGHAMEYGMPMGMPTAGFAPAAVPPHMIAGGPTWGMPITGTPVGLPGPPHVPLGAPAGLMKHTMKNRTRVLMPPPTAAVNMTVKHRPGLNYPRPVSNVQIDETQREPLRLWPFASLFGRDGYFGGRSHH